MAPSGTLTTVIANVLFGPPASTTSPSFALDTFKTHNPGKGGGGKGGEGTIREWSSLIGIVTAIVGNILISFALNIQRYAHVRIDREWERERQRSGWRSDIAESQASLQPSSTKYGTVTSTGELGDHEREGFQDEVNGANRGRVSRDGNATGRDWAGQGGLQPFTDGAGRDGRNGRDGDVSSQGFDHLQHSFLSDRTVTLPEKTYDSVDRRSYLRSPYWWAGIVLMTIGEAGNFLAYGFAPASIVSPLGVVALVSNCLIAPFMLKETFRRRDFCGVVIAIGGAVTIVLSAKTSETKIGPDDIWKMITRWQFELYLGITIALILVLMWASERYGSKTILIDLGLVGLFGGYTALPTKGVASLLSFTLWHAITYWITYILVAILVFSALMQIRYINRALQRFDSTQVIPTQFVLFTIAVVVGSAVLYGDFESATLEQAIKFVGGCLLTFLGVYLITSGRVRPDEDVPEEDEEEEVIGLLADERYQERIDPFQGTQGPGDEGLSPIASRAENRPQSPTQSLPIEDVDGEDPDVLQTPRVPLSSSPSSPVPSLSAISSLSQPEDSHPQPLLANPWLESQGDHAGSVSAPAIDGAQAPANVDPPQAELLFRFPSAPGVTESSPGPHIQTPTGSPLPPPETPVADTSHVTPRRRTASRTADSSLRKSLSITFEPPPLFAPLSGTLSGVVVESLRRGEGSPGRQRSRTSGRKGKGKERRNHPDDAIAQDRAGEVEVEDETEGSVIGTEDDVIRSRRESLIRS